jgi:hypothetical protein
MKVEIIKLPSKYTIYNGKVVTKSSITTTTTSATSTASTTGVALPSQLQYINALGERVVNASVEDYLKRLATKSSELISTTNKLQSETNKLTQRVSKLERTAVTKPYNPPKVSPKYLTSKKGRPVDMNVLLTALEADYGQLRQALGGSANLLKSTRTPNVNLSSESLLGKDKGTLNDLPSWYKAPADVSQSMTNVWLTLMDIREAVTDLKTHTTPTTCSAIKYGAQCSLRDASGIVNGLRIIFTNTELPTGWKDSNTAKGCKIVIKDSSLNTITRYVQIHQYLNNDKGFEITNIDTLDTSSNFEVTIEYSFTDGSNECAKIETHTVTNNTTCPTVVLSSATDEKFTVTVNNISTTAGYDVAINVEDPGGSIIETVRPGTSAVTFTKEIKGLNPGTTYSVYVETTSKAGNVSTCPKSSITTTAPACSVTEILNADYNTSATTLPFIEGGATQILSCYTSGGTTEEIVAGFDATNSPIIYKGALIGGTCADGVFVKYGNPISLDPTTSINLGGKLYPATGIARDNEGSGWRFLAPITSPRGVVYYLYALYNHALHRIDKVVYACDCKGVFISDSTDVTTTDSSYRKQYYCEAGNSVIADIKILTNTTSKTAPTWSVVVSPVNGTVQQITSPTGEENSIGRFKYISTAANGWGSDSFKVQVTNDCGTSNMFTIPIQEASRLTYTDQDVYVFVDSNNVSDVDANNIKTQFENIKGQLLKNCRTWTGSIYYIPVSNTAAASANSSSNYLEYIRAMWDMKAGATGSITVASGTVGAVNWDTWKSLPPYWGSGTTLPVPAAANVIAFTNGGYTNGDYSGANLPAGWGSQPTTVYKDHYDSVVDLFNGTAHSTWASSKHVQVPQFSQSFKFTLVPLITGSLDESAATALQMYGAIAGKRVKEQEFNGVMIGNVEKPVNLANFMVDTIAPIACPYNGATTTHNTMTGLNKLETHVQFNLFSNITSNFTFASTNTDFKNFVLGLMQSYTTTPNSAFNKCATSVIAASHMTGTDAGQAVELYASNTTCQTAGSTSAGGPTGCSRIYNVSGIEFKSDERAYATLAGALNGGTGVTNDELINGRWYCQYNPVAKGSTSRKVAQYNTSAPYWRNAAGAAGHETIAAGSCT